jgi:hypothetical protein
MGRTRDDGHARLADGHRPGAMDDGQALHVEAFRHLIRDRREDPSREFVEGLVLESQDLLRGIASSLVLLAWSRAARRLAGDSQEGHDRADTGVRDCPAQLGHERVIERARGELEPPERLDGDPAQDGRGDGPARSRRDDGPARSRRDPAPARYRRDDGDLVTVGKGRLSFGVLPVACETHVRPSGSENRETAD